MLRQAGVPVTATGYQGIICDFVVLNVLRGTRAAEAAVNQAIVVSRMAPYAS
jgi:acetyl esterase